MGKKVRWIIMIAALLVFLCSGGAVLVIKGRYQASREGYVKAAETYTRPALGTGQASRLDEGLESSGESAAASSQGEAAPITVDFDRLREEHPEVVGWLYCPDTVIDYPVVRGEDNDFYLHHSYTGTEDQSGAIFVDAGCVPGFADSNSVIYGHSMNDGSMFGGLSSWKDPEYAAAHPVMWLLTPEADYRVQLFSGYTTSATSETYTIFRGSGEELDRYLSRCREQSDFPSDVELAGDGRYVLLSTCAYEFEEARYVLHGRLEAR